jgi:hypothetical protein
MTDSGGCVSRRHFLKTTAAGALALTSLPALTVPRKAWAYEPGGRIHPNVSPLRVVGVRDAAMALEAKVPPAIVEQNKLVAVARVHENIDRMAMVLADERDPALAWRKILVKPAGKVWPDVTVALKTNHIAMQRVRSAVVSKVCRVLTDVAGVKGENVHLYDACHGGSINREAIYSDLPAGVRIENQWGGSNAQVPVPAPYLGGQKQARCLGPLASGQVDILINVALCKGHSPQFGRFTMACKNHFGTFDPGPSHGAGGGPDYLLGINKSAQILGEIDPDKGGVAFPRQQLCIVDALWASDPGPSGPPTAQPNALLMGVFGPALDYVAATDFRRDTMGWPINEPITQRFLTEFGFSPSDLPDGGKIVDALESAP